MNVNDYQIGGKHYQSEFQHWDFVIECLGGQYLEGCISKYVTRWRKKNGIQDLQKALHYLAKLADTEECAPIQDFNKERIDEFCKANSVGGTERRIIYILATWENTEALDEARRLIEQLINEWHEEHTPAFHA